MRLPYGFHGRHAGRHLSLSLLSAYALATAVVIAATVPVTSSHSRIHENRQSSLLSISQPKVTVVLPPVRSKQVAPEVVTTDYTVRPGDTLSSIAAQQYHDESTWPALWWVNRHTVKNPNALQVGQVLTLSSWHPKLAWLLRSALRAVPQVVQLTSSVTSYSAAASYRHSAAIPSYASAGGSFSYFGGTPGGAFGLCVVARESGGNAQVMNSTGHYGLYQFSASTWASYGGNPADFGHATVAEQERVFANALAAGGQANWSPYDGC